MTSTVSPPRSVVLQVNAPTSLPLRRNIVWTLTGWTIYSGCQWLLLVVLARFGTPAIVGQFSLALAVTAPIVVLVSLQLRVVQATDSDSGFRFSDYLAARLIGLALGMFAISTITLSIDFSWEARLAILLMGIAKGIEAISDIYYGSFQKHERMDLFSRSLLFKGPLSAALFTGVFIATQNLFWTIAALSMGWGIVLVAYDLPAHRRMELQLSHERIRQAVIDWKAVHQIFLVALPLGLVAGLMSLEINVPRYFVNNWCGEAELGNFTAICYLLFGGEIIVVSMSHAAIPRLAKLFRTDCAQFWSTLVKLLGAAGLLGLTGCFIATAAGHTILSAVFGDSYAAQAGTFAVLASAAALQFCATTLAFAMRAMRKFRTLLTARLISTSLLVALCACLAPRFGIVGASWSIFVAAAVHLLVMFAICVRIFVNDVLNMRVERAGQLC